MAPPNHTAPGITRAAGQKGAEMREKGGFGGFWASERRHAEEQILAKLA